MVRKLLWLSVLAVTVAGAAQGEELVLKDGTKVVGRMTAIKGDSIEITTPYGKMQVPRADIRSITFPETAPAAEPEKKPVATDEELDGTRYVNNTGHFTLTVPTEWKINPQLRAGAAESIAGLSSRGSIQFLLVVQEQFSGSMESYRGLLELQWKSHLSDYEKVSESAVTIDGHPAMLVSYRGTSPKANNLPIHFLAGIIRYDKEMVQIVTWCVEPLFNETQRTFEDIINSYRKLPEPTPGTTKPAS